MPADDDRLAILGPANARGERGLGLRYGECSGHPVPPVNIMVIKTIVTIIPQSVRRKGESGSDRVNERFYGAEDQHVEGLPGVG